MDVLVRIDPERRQTTDVLYPICEVYCVEDPPKTADAAVGTHSMDSDSLQTDVVDTPAVHTHILNAPVIGPELMQCIDSNIARIKAEHIANMEHREFKCSLCFMAFKNRYHLNRHMRTHTDVREFRCEKCGSCFKRKEHLARHTENVHFEIKKELLVEEDSNMVYLPNFTFKCSNCNEPFHSEHLLQEHAKIHEVAKEIGYKLIGGDVSCENIKPSNKTPPADKRYVCKVCHIGFNRNHHLRRHELSHSDVRNFKCDTCQSLFRRKEHLERHKYVHSELRIHKCQHCEKTFKRREHLYKHSATHGYMWRPFNEA